jgi:hypothetical protein
VTARSYPGRCHCGALRFELTSEPITAGVRCNCSICVRKGAMMSVAYYPQEAFARLEGAAGLTRYQWGDRDVNHYFCPTCGIYVFNEVTARPGHLRINLGCLDDIDPLALGFHVIDGRSF